MRTLCLGIAAISTLLFVSCPANRANAITLGDPSANQRWSCFLRQAVKVDSAMKRVIHHEDAETVFG
jgi:hypothetical protein